MATDADNCVVTKVIVEGGELCGLKDLPQHRAFSPEERFRIRSEQQNKMKFTLFSAVLFSIAWMSVVGTGDVRPVDCCYSLTDIKPPVVNIVKYDMQDPALCGIRAVRFYTKKNKVVCSDPESKYAKRAMYIVDGRTATTPTICYTSTTNTIPAVTTTNKTPGKNTETIKGNGGPESCCNFVTTTTIPVKSILKNHIKSRSKKGLRRFQAGYTDITMDSSTNERRKYSGQIGEGVKTLSLGMDECCRNRFYTKKNKVVCSDPESKYAKKAILPPHRPLNHLLRRRPLSETLEWSLAENGAFHDSVWSSSRKARIVQLSPRHPSASHQAVSVNRASCCPVQQRAE
ncbi:cytokine SCM-1 beta-like [Pimephales promelas]|nr:cytokine SCM-1 beta-like [Pimephales promelas]